MKLFGLLNTKDGADAEESPGAAGRTALSATSVALVIKHFPIGTRLQYFAEYQKSSKNETIVVAYSINDHLIYSQKDIQAITRDGRRGFVATVQGTPVFFDRVSALSIFSCRGLSAASLVWRTRTIRVLGRPRPSKNRRSTILCVVTPSP
jgi:microsomal dipeptidase-like Zn-dependent dipeptidase